MGVIGNSVGGGFKRRVLSLRMWIDLCFGVILGVLGSCLGICLDVF